MQKGAKIDKRNGDDKGGTPLTTAVLSGNVKMIMLLRKKGADVNAPGVCGKTPLQLAEMQQKKIIRELDQIDIRIGKDQKKIIGEKEQKNIIGDFIKKCQNSLKPAETNNLTAIQHNSYKKIQEKKLVGCESSPNEKRNTLPKCAFYKMKEEATENNNPLNVEANNFGIKSSL